MDGLTQEVTTASDQGNVAGKLAAKVSSTCDDVAVFTSL